MRLLVLSEGDAGSQMRSGSGTPNSLLVHFRKHGHQVLAGDVDLHGVPRLLGAAAAFAPNRRRWMVKFHLAAAPFALRSRNARRLVRRHAGEIDFVLQYGATCAPPRGEVPYYLYCDSHVAMSRTREPHMWTSSLSVAEFERAVEQERQVYEGASGIFTFSEGVRQSFLREFGLPADRVVTAFPGPNLDIDAVPARRPDDRARSGGPPADVLFVGKEFERKGGDLLVRAMRRVREVMPEATLTVIGPRNLRLDEPGVRVLGYLSKDDPAQLATITQAYASARVFALPTRFEPFGLVLLEAMLHGLPCVASNVGAIPEIIVEGETGFIVPADDEQRLADRLLTVLRDPALGDRMGAAGRERVLRGFTWDSVVRTMERRIAADLESRDRTRRPHATAAPE